MQISLFRNVESWIDSVLEASYKDHGYMSYFPDGQYNDSNRWGIVLSFGAYGSNLDNSNDETITAHMLKAYPRQCKVVCPVFKVSGLWVMLKRKDGKPTQAALHMFDILYDLENKYPVFDSDDLDQREYDQQISSIESIVGSYVDNAPDDFAREIFSYLWDNDQDSVISEDHAYCDDLGVYNAAIQLGYIDISDTDDLIIPEYLMRDIDRWIVSAFNKTRF